MPGSYLFCWWECIQWALQEFSNDMWHTTFMQVNQGDYWLLVVGSQIHNLTPDTPFGHSLCFKYPNGL